MANMTTDAALKTLQPVFYKLIQAADATLSGSVFIQTDEYGSGFYIDTQEYEALKTLKDPE